MNKNYALILIACLCFVVSGYGQTTIATQDFDGDTPTWTYTNNVSFFDNGFGSDGFYGILDYSSASPILNTNFSNNILAENDLDDEGNGTSGFADINFASINISSYNGVVLSFDYDIVGYNANNDDARYQVYYNGIGQGLVYILDGNGAPTDATGSVNINIPNAVNSVYLVVSIRDNGGSGYSGFDNFLLEGMATSPCFITDIAVTPTSACNDAINDYYLADVEVTFSSPPSTGTLELTGSGIIGGTTSVAIGTSSQTISGVQLAANGSDVEITANFSDNSCPYTEIVIGSAVSSCSSGSSCGNLYISEYIEGSANNKCIEIYNNTGSSVDLAAQNYAIHIYANGNSTVSSTVSLTGVLANNDVHVICDTFADAGFLSVSDQTSGGLGFNGDDAVVLNHNGTDIDIIGQIGNDPGSEWGSGVQSTQDNSLTRKCSLTCPSDNNGANTFNPSTEWDGFSQNVSDLGQYICTVCSGPDAVTAFTSINVCGVIELQWILPTCFDEVVVVVRAATPVNPGLTLSGESTAYSSGNSDFDSGDNLTAGQFVAYVGSGTSATITGLTDATTYHFSIYTEFGGSWITGSTTNTMSSSSGSAATTFIPGDLVFIGFDSYLGDDYTSDAQGDDIFSIMNLVDIGPGTTFTMANLLYEWNAPSGVSTNKWYNCGGDFDAGVEPPYVTLQYNGCADIPQGSVICIGVDQFPALLNGISINGIDAFSDFSIIDNPSHLNDDQPGNMSTSSPDTIWLMQGTFSDVTTDNTDGPDAGGQDDVYRTFNGVVLGGLQTKGSFQSFNVSGDAGGPRVSRVHPDIECFYQETGPTSDTAFYGYHNGLTTGTAYQLLQDITNNSNWVIASANQSDPGQNQNNLITTCNSNYTINGPNNLSAGQWLGRPGATGEDWFNCRNWENFVVPDTVTDVVINSSSIRDCVIDYDSPNADSFLFEANCNNITISNRTLFIEESSGTNIDRLNVLGNLRIEGTGVLDMNDGNSATTDGELYLSGNWFNHRSNPTLNSAFDQGNSTVIFNSTTLSQAINFGNAGVPPAPSTETFFNVVLDNDFDLAFSVQTLYMDGDLTINANRSLTVQSNQYVYVGDRVINNNSTNGSFTLEDSASLIQAGTVNNNVGNLTMKRNALIENYDYVYWSSPVSGFDTSNLFDTTSNHIYIWDTTMNNIPFGGSGQGYWVVPTNPIMTQGKGYIARSPNYSIPTWDETVFDNGVPNNGDVNLNLSRGTVAGMDDDDWNLVGNPYPSAISANDFLLENSVINPTIEGYIDIWTHGAPPVTSVLDPFYENNNGYNYDPNDYVRYNYMGGTIQCGPDGGVAPPSPYPCFDGYIAAGQAFMVNMVNGPSTTLNNVPLFNNTMRSRIYGNSDFFRISSASETSNTNSETSAERHRIWLDLASENNGVNRILVGYATNATIGRDILYDAIISNAGNDQNFYSIIEDKSFNIQGRGLPFVDTDIIPLGFVCIAQDNFTIAIDGVDGLFNNGQTIYLKDNLINFVHNLSANPYTFTSEIGEFNDRFEIVFQAETLSVIENEISPNDLSIVELGDGNVKFSVGNGLIITTVEIIDIVGRTVYNLNGNNNIEVYNLSRLSQAAYIAKVTLSNGQIITKKAVKRK